MKVSVEDRIINNFSENLVNRKYRAIRRKRNQAIAISGLVFGFAASDAIAHKGLMTIIMGGFTLFNLKSVELGTRALRVLKPQYLEILNRAKSINKIRQAQ